MLLSPLLQSHKHWDMFQDTSRNGARYEFREISEGQRKADIASAVARDNHKSASARPDFLEELVKDYVISSLKVPMPIETA